MLSLKIFFSKRMKKKNYNFFFFFIYTTSENLIKETIVLSDDSGEVRIYMSGYITKKN